MGEIIQEKVGEMRIESVKAMMPKMNIFCYLSNPSTEGLPEVSYGNEKLSVSQMVPFEQTEEGISYYMMLDVSASISSEYFAQIKSAVLQFQQNMKPQDDLTVITFGNEIKVICQNYEQTDDLSQLLEELSNTDENTLLFQAIQKTAELADLQENKLKRKVSIAITDGEDFSQNTSTQAEALKTLQEKSVPLYAMAVQAKKSGEENPYIDSMGEFARSSGGTLEVFGLGEAGQKLSSMQEMFYQAYVIAAEAGTNQVSYTAQPLTVILGEHQIETLDFTAMYYETDTEQPVAKVKKVSEHKLEVSFNEPVKNAEAAENYQITIDENTPLAVYTAEYAKEDTKAVLSFQEELYNGTYQITFQNITDASMEENPLTEACTVKVADGARQEKEGIFQRYPGVLAGCIVGAVILIAALAGFLVIRRRRGLVTVEGKAVLASNLEKKHHVVLEKKSIPAKTIQFQIEGMADGEQWITAEVRGSLFVGRSKICDIYIDDEKMSKQHFVIYESAQGFDIEDLHSTNGTKVNERSIHGRTGLSKGDKIKAGEVRMTVRW